MILLIWSLDIRKLWNFMESEVVMSLNNTNATIPNIFPQYSFLKQIYTQYRVMELSQFLITWLHNLYQHLKPNKILLLDLEFSMIIQHGTFRDLCWVSKKESLSMISFAWRLKIILWKMVNLKIALLKASTSIYV